MKKYIAVVGERCPDTAIARILSLSAIEDVVKLPPDSMISEPIADHPDSLICIFDEKLLVHSKYAMTSQKELSYIAEKCGLVICPVECERGDVYPLDCGFNALSLPDRKLLIGRRKSLADPLKRLVNGDTNQGYAGCTALYAGGTVITADSSIEKSAKSLHVPVYKISGNDISLPGYNVGFIGGAGGAFDSTVCLFGSSEYSNSAREVELFCQINSLTLVCLEDGILTDRGGIKFVETKSASV